MTEKLGKKFSKNLLESEKTKQINQFVILILNGEDIKAQKGLETQLKEGDVLSFMPAIAGG